MSSREGFARADVDTSLFDDRKVRKLLRALGGDPRATRDAIGLYVGVLLASWREDYRQTLEEGAPLLWTSEDIEAYAPALCGTGWLDSDGRVPEETFARWTEPARVRSAKGRAGAAARWSDRQDSGTAGAMPEHRPGNANRQPDNQTPRRARPRATSHSEMTPLRDALIANGLDPSLLPKPKEEQS